MGVGGASLACWITLSNCMEGIIIAICYCTARYNHDKESLTFVVLMLPRLSRSCSPLSHTL